MKLMMRFRGWLHGHLTETRQNDGGWSTLEATLLLAAAGAAALALVAAFNGVFDGLLDDFNGVFGG